jgi:hypothetical protein
MKRSVLLFGGLVLALGIDVHPQANKTVLDLPDTRYREDQFYLGTTYNFWRNAPQNVTQRNFSYGVLFGFIRDMPINTERTLAVGIGAGYAFTNYYSNLRAVSGTSDTYYEIPGLETPYNRNKLSTSALEIPLELRWRNSNPTDYAFWRVYAGLKLGYNLLGRSKFVSDTFKENFINSDVRKLQYGFTLSTGYNAFTLHLYYGLNGLIKDGAQIIGDAPLEVKPLRFGLIFYVL